MCPRNHHSASCPVPNLLKNSLKPLRVLSPNLASVPLRTHPHHSELLGPRRLKVQRAPLLQLLAKNLDCPRLDPQNLSHHQQARVKDLGTQALAINLHLLRQASVNCPVSVVEVVALPPWVEGCPTSRASPVMPPLDQRSRQQPLVPLRRKMRKGRLRQRRMSLLPRVKKTSRMNGSITKTVSFRTSLMKT